MIRRPGRCGARRAVRRLVARRSRRGVALRRRRRRRQPNGGAARGRPRCGRAVPRTNRPLHPAGVRASCGLDRRDVHGDGGVAGVPLHRVPLPARGRHRRRSERARRAARCRRGRTHHRGRTQLRGRGIHRVLRGGRDRAARCGLPRAKHRVPPRVLRGGGPCCRGHGHRGVLGGDGHAGGPRPRPRPRYDAHLTRYAASRRTPVLLRRGRGGAPFAGAPRRVDPRQFAVRAVPRADPRMNAARAVPTDGFPRRGARRAAEQGVGGRGVRERGPHPATAVSLAKAVNQAKAVSPACLRCHPSQRQGASGRRAAWLRGGAWAAGAAERSAAGSWAPGLNRRQGYRPGKPTDLFLPACFSRLQSAGSGPPDGRALWGKRIPETAPAAEPAAGSPGRK